MYENAQKRWGTWKRKEKGDDTKCKGTGNWYQGTRWRCGKVGHKAWECESKQVGSVEEEAGEEDENGGENVQISTVWSIEAVDKEIAAVNHMEVDAIVNNKKDRRHRRFGSGCELLAREIAQGHPNGAQDERGEVQGGKRHRDQVLRHEEGAVPPP